MEGNNGVISPKAVMFKRVFLMSKQHAPKGQKYIAQGNALPFIHIFDNSQHITFAEEIVKSCFESCISWT